MQRLDGGGSRQDGRLEAGAATWSRSWHRRKVQVIKEALASGWVAGQSAQPLVGKETARGKASVSGKHVVASSPDIFAHP